MGKGSMGVLMKVLGANDYRLTVTAKEAITHGFLRLEFNAGGLLENHPPHPTQWVRLWIPTTTGHQRGYTLVDQDPKNDRFSIEFALHADGPASIWAKQASVGDHIDATMLGSKFNLPEPMPQEFIIFGDAASLPAINTLLDAIGDTPARVWLEWQHESETEIPVHRRPAHTVTWIRRVDSGRLLREAAEHLIVPENSLAAGSVFAWVACEWRTTRAITKTLKTVHGLPKGAIKSQAYWK